MENPITVNVEKPVWKKLVELKLKWDLESLNEVIERLIKDAKKGI